MANRKHTHEGRSDPDLKTFSFHKSPSNIWSVSGYGDEAKRVCVCVCVCVLKQWSTHLTPVVLWSVALGSSGDAQVLHIKYSFPRNSWVLNNSQRSLPKASPCYPGHVPVWTMDSGSRRMEEEERGRGEAERATVNGNWLHCLSPGTDGSV